MRRATSTVLFAAKSCCTSSLRRRRAGGETMKALFLGNVAADTANGIRAELPPELDVEIVADPKELTSKAAAETDILVTNIWHADYPLAPRIAFVQSVATGIEWIEQPALPAGVPICNAYGHETAIAEYVLMVMLVWSHRFREIESDFRLRSSWAPSWVKSGAPAVLGCRILAANRSPREAGDGIERIYPLTALHEMLPLCDTVAICTAFGPETERLFDASRLALMKRTAFLVNIARGAIIDEDALYPALRDGTIGGAAIDVWWQYPDPAEPERRGAT